VWPVTASTHAREFADERADAALDGADDDRARAVRDRAIVTILALTGARDDRQGVDVGTMMCPGGRSSYAAIGPDLGEATSADASHVPPVVLGDLRG